MCQTTITDIGTVGKARGGAEGWPRTLRASQSGEQFPGGLTACEAEVLSLIAHGLSNAEIARLPSPRGSSSQSGDCQRSSAARSAGSDGS